MSPQIADLIKAVAVALLGAGGPIGIWLTLRKKDPLPREKVQQAEAVQAIEATGVVGEWRQLVDGLKGQNDLLRVQNEALHRQNGVLVQQNTLLREAHSVDVVQKVRALAYVDDLRQHIHEGKPPPPPAWPAGLEAI